MSARYLWYTVEIVVLHRVMKFSEHLTAHVTPEWHKQYITYEVSAVLIAQYNHVDSQ